MEESIKEMEESGRELIERLKSCPKSDWAKGISLLQVRNQALCHYLMLLTRYMIHKVKGVAADEQLIWDLVCKRLTLEKTKPLEFKLNYQIDKLVLQSKKNLHVENVDLVDPLQFKPNPSMMLPLDLQQNSKDDVYRPPKIAPIPFHDGKERKMSKLSERVKEKASKSRLLKDLACQYDEKPESMDVSGVGYGAKELVSKADQEWNEREAFEEENFVRLTVSKKEKKQQLKMQKQGGLIRFNDEFNDLQKDFSELRGVHHAVEQDFKQNKSKRMSYLKRKSTDEDVISSMAKKRASLKGKDKFKESKKAINFKARAG